ncbi:MAG: pre-peptidase C-terminal domain-containing protein [Candidatus Sumerlaeota bacterium]|nr:pre-peptidase C-terminal domain-containing protein [Candidatus Sumerlaeota bacterium]
MSLSLVTRADDFDVVQTWQETRNVGGKTMQLTGQKVHDRLFNSDFIIYLDSSGHLLPTEALAQGASPTAAFASALSADATATPGTMKPGAKPAPMKALEKAIPKSVSQGLTTPSVSIHLDPLDLARILAEEKPAASKEKSPLSVGIVRQFPESLNPQSAIRNPQSIANPQSAIRNSQSIIVNRQSSIVNTASGFLSLKNGGKLWTAAIESPEAKAIRIHLTGIALPKGAQVMVYNTLSPQESYGPYQSKDWLSAGDYWTESVFASQVTVECYLPPDLSDRPASFEIREIAHIYQDLAKLARNSQLGTPNSELGTPKVGACHNDITCYPSWTSTGNSVAGYLYVSGSYTYWCTGSLLNDADNTTYIDYFMTANHCISDEASANSAEFYWFYQTSSCDGTAPDRSTATHTGGGAVYLAGQSAAAGNDYSFLRLRNASPGGVVYAGWTIDTPAPSEQVTCIHHPDGSYKRISLGGIQSSDADWWGIQFSSGVTEPGSSGAPLYNAGQFFIGQLYGGDSSCSNLTGIDSFGRFSVSYPSVRQWLERQQQDDNYEPNNTLATAFDLTNWKNQLLSNLNGFGIQYDDDWYKIQSPAANTRLQITCTFTHSQGDIDIQLYSAAGVLLAESATANDQETINYLAPAAGAYYIRVFYGNAGNTYDLIWNATPVATPSPSPTPNPTPSPTPSVPSGVTAQSGLNPGEIILHWNSAAHASGYYIYYDDGALYPPFIPAVAGAPLSGANAGNVTQVTIAGLAPGQSYVCAVKAYNARAISGYSAQTQARATLPPDDAYEPDNTTATAYNLSGNRGRWLSMAAGKGIQADDDWYRIAVAPGYERIQALCEFSNAQGNIDCALHDSTGTLLALSATTADSEFIDCPVTTAGIYFLRVFGANAGNPYDLWWTSLPPAIPTPAPAPNAPTGVIAQTAGASGQIVLRWNPAPRASGYTIYYDEDSANPPFDPVVQGIPLNGADVSTHTEITITNLTPGQLYYCAVKAYSAAGESPFSYPDCATAGGGANPDDAYEPNNILADAYDLSGDQGQWLLAIHGLGVQKDDDWYRIRVTAGAERVLGACTFTNSAGDIDIALYNILGAQLALSNGHTNTENFDYRVPAAGYYFIRVFGAGQGNAYNLRWDAQAPSPTPTPSPQIGVNPTSLTNTCMVGRNATSQTLDVWNSGGGTLNYSVSCNASWLSVSPSSGASKGEHHSVAVMYSTADLPAGSRNAAIIIAAAGASNTPKTISVALTVAPSPTPTPAPQGWYDDYLIHYHNSAGRDFYYSRNRGTPLPDEITSVGIVITDPTACTLDISRNTRRLGANGVGRDVPKVVTSGTVTRAATQGRIREMTIGGGLRSFTAYDCFVDKIAAGDIGAIRMTASPNSLDKAEHFYTSIEGRAGRFDTVALKTNISLGGIFLAKLSVPDQIIASVSVNSRKVALGGNQWISEGGIGTPKAPGESFGGGDINGLELRRISLNGASIDAHEIRGASGFSTILTTRAPVMTVLFDGGAELHPMRSDIKAQMFYTGAGRLQMDVTGGNIASGVIIGEYRIPYIKARWRSYRDSGDLIAFGGVVGAPPPAAAVTSSPYTWKGQMAIVSGGGSQLTTATATAEKSGKSSFGTAMNIDRIHGDFGVFAGFLANVNDGATTGATTIDGRIKRISVRRVIPISLVLGDVSIKPDQWQRVQGYGYSNETILPTSALMPLDPKWFLEIRN